MEIVEKAPMNDNGSKPISARSTFPVNYNLAGTYRFGEIGVCSVQDTVPNEEVPLHSGHDVRSMNLKAPLLGELKLHKEFFDVPDSVILPLNYEKLFTQPQIGEDVDASKVGCAVSNLELYFKNLFQGFITAWNSAIADEEIGVINFKYVIQFVLSLERVYSSGNLLSSLGEQLYRCLSVPGLDIAPDEILNFFIKTVINSIRSAESDGYDLELDGETIPVPQLTDSEILEKLRDAHSIEFSPGYEISDNFEDFFSDKTYSISGLSIVAPERPLSLKRPWAYQLAVAEFFTNSHVDYIYSAELYRQNIWSLYKEFMSASGVTFVEEFSLNGIKYRYDYLSASFVVDFLSGVLDTITPDDFSSFEYFNAWTGLVLGFRRSLRYVDYFTGSRTRPLAVGDVNVAVNDGYVNIVDTITKRWYAKFLNQVNRAQRKLSEYMRALFPGLVMHRDYHDPMWLGSVSDVVNSPEVEGTTDSNKTVANTTTSVLRSNADRYAFEYSPERYGTVIGLVYFDIKRYYTGGIERPNFMVDRNDHFNPFLQFVGDQPVYLDELDASQLHSDFFGYQGRDMQYKQRVDQCFGGFSSGDLPGWLFIARPPIKAEGETPHVSPDYIRSKSSELDDFYSSLTGYTFSKRWHFIIINKNWCELKAPMVYNPQLD